MSISPRFIPTTFTRLATVLGLALVSCAPQKVDSSGEGATVAVTAAATGTGPGNLDVLFMIDNSSSMHVMQQKLASQIPAFLTALQSLPTGLPNIHIAVVSSDMGAPGDSTSSILCTVHGDDGQFRIGTTSGVSGAQQLGPDGGALGGAPGGNDAGALDCAGASLNSGATFISDVGGVANYTGDLSALLSCMTTLGDNGCGFENQLASISRALGADGTSAPSSNAGFLRPDAQLAIIVLSNEDDCSAPASTSLYSLDGYQQNISNPMGPIANYRCNEYGHLCVDPAAGGQACVTAPPLNPPAHAQNAYDPAGPTLNLTDCESDDSRDYVISSVNGFVNGIKALKADPDNQIVVGAIVAPPTPYTVAWVPETGGQNTHAGELWPQVEHSCGPAGGDGVNPRATMNPTDGSFGDPAVRIAQWVKAFGANGVMASICDGSYANAFTAVVNRIGAQLQAGGSSGAGASGAGGTTGTGTPAICPNGIPGAVGGDSNGSGPSNGLQNGGCAVAAARPTAVSLGVLLFLFVYLAIIRRRRVSARRSSGR
jgi:hypothetical protein